ncbi:MAG: ImmA/IrrE family metallo-endopeptidase [Pseudomonadota bacterium]
MSFIEPTPSGLSKVSVDNLASEIAQTMQLKPGGDLTPHVTALGGEIKYGWSQLDEYSGGSITIRSPKDFVIVLSDVTSPKRDRFTIAHELGHFFLHYPILDEGEEYPTMRATREKREGDDNHERSEWEANWFAAGLLMPRQVFHAKALELTNEQLAVFFNVSTIAIDVRKRTLGIE